MNTLKEHFHCLHGAPNPCMTDNFITLSLCTTFHKLVSATFLAIARYMYVTVPSVNYAIFLAVFHDINLQTPDKEYRIHTKA